MKSMKKLMLVLAALALVLFAFGACNRDNEDEGEAVPDPIVDDTPDPAPTEPDPEPDPEPTDAITTLRVLFSGPGTMPDTQMVIDAFNEALLQRMPNTQADIEFVAMAHYEERLRLMMAANETLDIANLHNGGGDARNNIVTMSRMGATTPLDDILATRPEWFELISEGIWNFSRVDGVTHMIPINRDATDRYVGIFMQRWLAEEHMDVVRMREILTGDNGALTREAWDIMTDYLRNIQEAGELRRGASPQTMRWLPERAFYSLFDRAFVIRHEGDGVTVEHFFETDDALLMFEMFDLWWREGLIYQGVLTASDRRQWERQEDGHSLFMAGYHHYDPTYTGPTRQWNAVEGFSDGWGWDVYGIPWARNFFSTPVNLQGLFVPRTSQDPEMAVDLLWHLFSDWELQAYIAHGIEGVHWERNPENYNNLMATIAEAEQQTYRGQLWNTGNMLLVDPHSLQTDWVDYQRNIVVGRAIPTVLASFQLDIDPIAIQIERYNAVRGEFEWPLIAGATGNWEAQYAMMIEQMRIAGADEILAEIQRQVDEYIGR